MNAGLARRLRRARARLARSRAAVAGAKAWRLLRSPWARALTPILAIALALWLAHAQLGETSAGEVLAAMAATPPAALVLAFFFTALGFAALALVEGEALAFIGRPLPWPRVALASFVANAFSAAFGFGALSGTAARARLYASSHLSPADLARLTLVTSASSLLSGAVVEGLALVAAAPRLSWVAVPAGAALLAPAALWFVVIRRPRRRRHWRSLPDSKRAAALAAALIDWLAAAATLFVLAAHRLADFPAFLAVFCFGAVAASVLGTPAGLGVLDAIIVGLAARNPVRESLAALILFRAIYYIAPVLGAAAALGARALAGGAALARRSRGGKVKRAKGDRT